MDIDVEDEICGSFLKCCTIMDFSFSGDNINRRSVFWKCAAVVPYCADFRAFVDLGSTCAIRQYGNL